MENALLTKCIRKWDEKKDIALPGNAEQTIRFSVDHLIHTAIQAIASHGYFSIALSGGSTPKAIFQALAQKENKQRVDWSRCLIFWSDERSVPPSHPDSNYGLAMAAGISQLPLPPQNIFRMKAESDIEKHAAEYEQLIKTKIPSGCFDFMMLGMGEDGHTASLFPNTQGINENTRLAIANYVPQKNTWRMTLTFPCINASSTIAIYVIGSSKASMVKRVLKPSDEIDSFPVQQVGTTNHKALWILDTSAAANLSE